jgi:hypothetical protein
MLSVGSERGQDGARSLLATMEKHQVVEASAEMCYGVLVLTLVLMALEAFLEPTMRVIF